MIYALSTQEQPNPRHGREHDGTLRTNHCQHYGAFHSLEPSFLSNTTSVQVKSSLFHPIPFIKNHHEPARELDLILRACLPSCLLACVEVLWIKTGVSKRAIMPICTEEAFTRLDLTWLDLGERLADRLQFVPALKRSTPIHPSTHPPIKADPHVPSLERIWTIHLNTNGRDALLIGAWSAGGVLSIIQEKGTRKGRK